MTENARILTLEEFQREHPLIEESLRSVARGDAGELAAHLFKVETDPGLDNTKALAHTYFIASDADGRPRVNSLAKLMTCAAIEYAIPRSRIREADEIYARTSSEIPKGQLRNEALGLFTDIANTGEGGELLLYLLVERVLQLPQIISKMSLKTSPRLHYQGADGVHADINPDTGMLNLYWGESKIHTNIKDSITECFKSLAPYLLEPYGGAAGQTNDIRLLNAHVDPGNERIKEALKKYLDPNSPYFNKVHNCGICLVGGNFDTYPNSRSQTAKELVNEEVRDAIVEVLSDWKTHASNRIGIEGIETFSIHVFLIPFPDVQEFRTYFLKSLGVESCNE